MQHESLHHVRKGESDSHTGGWPACVPVACAPYATTAVALPTCVPSMVVPARAATPASARAVLNPNENVVLGLSCAWILDPVANYPEGNNCSGHAMRVAHQELGRDHLAVDEAEENTDVGVVCLLEAALVDEADAVDGVQGASNVVSVPVLDGELLNCDVDVGLVVDEHMVVHLLVPLNGDEAIIGPDGGEVDDSLAVLRRVKLDQKRATR